MNILEGNNVLNVQLQPVGSAAEPEILSFSVPATSPGAAFWPEATLKLPPADSYRMFFRLNPQPGSVELMTFRFAAVIPDPASPSGLITIPLDRSDGTYDVRGRDYIAKETYTYDPGLYNAMIAAAAAAQAAYQLVAPAWTNVGAVESAIMASWPAGWQNDPNWLYTHPFYSYPEWRDAHDAAQAASDAYGVASEAHQAAIDAFQASEVRTYTRELIPATALVIALPNSYSLPRGNYPIAGSIFQTIGSVTTEFNFGNIGTLQVV